MCCKYISGLARPSASKTGGIRKIFSKIARRISVCLELSGRESPALSRRKALPPILILSETIRSRAGSRASPMPGQGASDGDLGLFARLACLGACVGDGLFGAGG